MKIKKRKVTKRKGLSLAETIVAAVLMTLLTSSALAISSFVTKTLDSAGNNLQVYSRTDYFARRINDSIRKAGTGHLVPRSSFVNSNLTANWNYIGLMNNVTVPESVSSTGKSFTASNALVYIEYQGPSAPDEIPEGANLLRTEDGYFVQYVFDYSFIDSKGYEYTFDLRFVTDENVDIASSMVKYEFETLVKKNGEVVKNLSSDSLLSKLNLRNATQVISHGTASDPATAIAFSNTFLPISSMDVISKQKSPATVVLVLDFSASMRNNSRLTKLKSSVTSLIQELSSNDLVNIILVPYASYAGAMYDYNSNPTWIYSLKNDSQVRNVINVVNSLNPPQSYLSTNPGDGLRVAYYKTQELKNRVGNLGKTFLITVTDGAMTSYTSSVNESTVRNYQPYNGSEWTPFYDKDVTNWFGWTYKEKAMRYYPNEWEVPNNPYQYQCARQYLSDWGNTFKQTFDPKTYLISVDNGMSAIDRQTYQNVFGTAAVDVTSVTDFQDVFSGIAFDINEYMWAFTGPKM